MKQLITQYTNNSGPGGGVLNFGPETKWGGGGYPTIPNGTPCDDSDLDGMPNAFESARPGLSNTNPADRNGDLDNDGYSNLEEYLDGIPDPGGSGPPPPPPPPAPITGRGVITEGAGTASGTGKVQIKGGPERRPFGAGTAQ